VWLAGTGTWWPHHHHLPDTGEWVYVRIAFGHSGPIMLKFQDYVRSGHPYQSGGPGDALFDEILVTDVHGPSPTNRPPDVEAGIDQTADEGGTITFSGSFTDPDSGDTHTYAWDFGDGDTDSGTLTPTHAYADNGSYPVTLTVTDNHGAADSDTLTVTVNNVAPSASIDSVEQPTADFILPNDLLEFTGSFTDPGILDTHTVEWDFGDGTAGIVGTLMPSHAYSEPGTYTVTLTVTDDDGGTGTASVQVLVESPAEATEVVIESIEELDLPQGTENSLTSKLESAIDSLEDGQDNAALNKLEAFVNQVEAQRGKKLTEEEADKLIADVQVIIAHIQGN
jgi:PKD repeat protein